jgi:hypothetical protein
MHNTIILFLVLVYSGKTLAQDVYNFYFQKNTPAVSTEEVEQPISTQAVATPALTSPELSRWEISPGVAWDAVPSRVSSSGWGEYDSNYGASGFSLIAGYRFNRFIALDGALSYTKVSSDGIDHGMFDGSIGGLATPIHINVFGYELIECAFGAGVMTSSLLRTTRDWENNIDRLNGSSKIFTPYASFRLAVNFTPEVAVFLDAKGGLGGGSSSDTSRGTAGLRVRF